MRQEKHVLFKAFPAFDSYLGRRNSTDSQLSEVQHKQHNVCQGWGVRGGGGDPDVVLLPCRIPSTPHTTGGGKRGKVRGRRERVSEKGWQTGSRDLKTQYCTRRVSCRLSQIRSSTLLKWHFHLQTFPAPEIPFYWACKTLLLNNIVQKIKIVILQNNNKLKRSGNTDRIICIVSATIRLMTERA